MKVSVIISVCDNRYKMFQRSLDTWSKQTMNTKDFELVIIDDSRRSSIHSLCKEYAYKNGLRFQIIMIDNSLCSVPITTFTPVLSNNVGFRQARGSVVCVTGPETLQSEKNLEIAYTLKNRKECAYGLVYKSNISFVDQISQGWNEYKDWSVSKLLQIKGAAADCLTKNPHPPAYWYFMAVSKKYVEKIGGVDERFGQGFCAEDDDIANRMRIAGANPVFEHRILGIHQDHSEIDKTSKKHSLRRSQNGVKLRKRNILFMQENKEKGIMLVNTNHTWGDPKVIIEHLYIG